MMLIPTVLLSAGRAPWLAKWTLALVTATGLVAGGFAVAHQYKDGGNTKATIGTGVTLQWVALGDSFSSGEGIPKFANQTCHRSYHAYPWLAAERLQAHVPGYRVQFNFKACSGAKIDDVASKAQHGWPNYVEPQLDNVNSGTDVVTITIGGNDLDFSRVITDCIVDPLPCLTKRSAAKNDQNVRSQGVRLYKLYKKLRGAINPNGHVFVLGYPELFPKKKDAWLNGRFCGGLVGLDEIQGAHDLTDKANSVIHQAADAAGVLYVDSTARFRKHEICGAPPPDWWFNGVLPNGHVEYSIHPNAAGQRALADALLERMQDALPRPSPAPQNIPRATQPSKSTSASEQAWTDSSGTTWKFSLERDAGSNPCRTDTSSRPFRLAVTNASSSAAREPSFFVILGTTSQSPGDVLQNADAELGSVGLIPGSCDSRHDAYITAAELPAGETKVFDGTTSLNQMSAGVTCLEVIAPDSPYSRSGQVILSVPLP